MSRARRLVILGGGGDLTGRYLLPSLAQLVCQGLLPEDADVVALGYDDHDDDSFRRYAAERLERHAAELPEAGRNALCERLSYVQGDATEVDDIRRTTEGATGPVMFYLALPPAIFAPAIEAIRDSGPGEEVRVVVEKPFGEDLAGAQRLNELLHDSFPEDHVFRVDHFLGLQTVQNLLGIRFGNRLFEPLWQTEHVASVELVWEETVALNARAGYYDDTGALRDMVQNHLLQLLALTAMERPASLSEGDLRDAKVAALRRVRLPSDLGRHTRRARYSAGRVEGSELPAYADEEGVDPERGTETFAEVTLFVDDDRWRHVPFVLRTGKALGADRHQIRLSFRPVADGLFDDSPEAASNTLTLTIQPDALVLDIALNGAGDPLELEPVQLRVDCPEQALPTYARLMLDMFSGDPTFSIRGDEAEESWRIVEPILEAWSGDAVPLEEYPAGSSGPDRPAG